MTDKQLTISEIAILLKVVEGNYKAFSVLQNQIEYLFAKNRRKNYWTYQVEFEIENDSLLLQDSLDANMSIKDTRVHIVESEVEFFVAVKISNGYIRWMNIGGDYRFQEKFTVKEVFWEVRNDDPRLDGKLVYDSSHRDYAKAITYSPMYK